MAAITSFFAKRTGRFQFETVKPPKKRPKRVPGRPHKAQSLATVVIDSGDDVLTLCRMARARDKDHYPLPIVPLVLPVAEAQEVLNQI